MYFHGCSRLFKNVSGRTQHFRAHHHAQAATRYSPPPSPQHFPQPIHPEPVSRVYHPLINGKPCDREGNFLPPNTPPPPRRNSDPDDWTPYRNRLTQMSASNIDTLFDLWASTLLEHNLTPLFANHSDLYGAIDSTPLGDVPWQRSSLRYAGEVPDGDVPQWMSLEYEFWFVTHLIVQNMIFDDSGSRKYKNFMSGDWAWEEAFYPLYLSIGSIHNNIRRAHCGGIALVAILTIPKTDKAHANDTKFRKFRRQIFHSSLSKILETLEPGMETPEIVRCADGHFRQAIYSLAAYIADYPEQALLACVVQGCTAKNTNLDGEGGRRSREHTEMIVSTLELGPLWVGYGLVRDIVVYPNIHKQIAPDLLHQLIKGVFKDHLVTWVGDYLVATYGPAQSNPILDDIDRRIAVAPPFSELRRFPQGRGFTQWTGDDSKALMKVYLPAIEGYVPRDILRAFRAFLEFCYIARRNVISEQTLTELRDALERFHRYRDIFEVLGIRPDGFALPQQHSMTHYFSLIWAFGAPNGLCSSITESMHIRAIKKPWRRSNRYKPLGQMLLTNQRLDKLAAARMDFTERGMLNEKLRDENDVDPENDADDRRAHNNDNAIVEGPAVQAYVELARTIQYKRNVTDLAKEIHQPALPELIRRFLYDQLYPESRITSSDVCLDACPIFSGIISVYTSAAATYYAPSDLSGVGGMHREHIRATPSWRQGPPRYDCAFVNSRPELDGMRGLDVVRILRFFSLNFRGVTYPCALVRWFSLVSDECDEDTGMWMVQPAVTDDGLPDISVIHLDCVVRAAHLLPIYGDNPIPRSISLHDTLDAFVAFYINKYVDHHAFEIAS
ncbi:hypothetical protein BJV77DRAFT_1062620 [Russula vinacea]|nr:hypothetical protein BJV77DRAFT_1062620 [Russula vinacea]